MPTNIGTTNPKLSGAQHKAFYEHYRAVLEGVTTHRDFDSKRREVAQTRTVLESGSAHRDRTARAAGLGPGAGEDRAQASDEP